MNPIAQNHKVRPCIVCDFPLSDKHHIRSGRLSRKHSAAIILCPNHHRCVHILELLLVSKQPLKHVSKTSQKYFDSHFRETLMPILLEIHEITTKIDQRLEDETDKLDDYGIYSNDRLEQKAFFALKTEGTIEFYITKRMSTEQKRLKNLYRITMEEAMD